MKKLLSLAIVLLFCYGLNAQVFEGTYKGKYSFKYETDQDKMVEQFKANVDKNPEIPAASKAMAKMMAKTLVKNYVTRQETEQHITSFPDGKFTLYLWIDGKNNRLVSFCPELGRVMVRFPGEGKDYIMYPKLGIGCKVEYAANESIKEMFTVNHFVDPTKDAKKINGITCIPAYNLFKYEDVGGEMVDTVTYKGVLWVKFPVDGYAHADYQLFCIQRNLSNEFLTSTENILKMTEVQIDGKNFVIPENINIMDTKKFVKQVKKIVDGGEVNEKMAISYDGDVPAVVWDIVK